MAMVQVEDPSKYGVVVTDDSCRVERFVEKPKVRIYVQMRMPNQRSLTLTLRSMFRGMLRK